MKKQSKDLDVIEVAREMVEINSANPFLSYQADDGTYAGISCENEINTYIESLLIDLGFKVWRQEVEKERDILVKGEIVHIPNRFNVLAEKGDGEDSILFFGHTDTVDVKLGWPDSPFKITQRKGEPEWKLYGLGANDMKSGIAAMLLGIGRTEIPEGTKIKVAILVDEEYWSYGANTLVSSDFLSDVKLSYVSEISDELSEPGEIWVGIGRLGRTEFEVELFGKSCHGADAAQANLSINAVHEAARLQNYLLDDYLLKKVTYKDSSIEISSSQYISNIEGGRAILSVPEYARFVIDKALVPGEDSDGEIAELFSIIDKLKDDGILQKETRVEIKERQRPTPACKPFVNKLESRAVSRVQEVLSKLEIRPIFGIGRSVADENRIAELGIPTLLLCPNGAGSHTNEEWVDRRSLEQLEIIYSEIVKATI